MSNGSHVKQIVDTVRGEALSRYLLGASDLLMYNAVAFLAGGHILLEGPPGTGKTKTGRLFAALLAKDFRRIQFTSDLLPQDIIGANVYMQDSREFKFIQGPIFADFVLADEINRAPPRTQSALLEAMEERQVTVEGKTYPLSKDFFVVATQNPQDLEGTFPLPEAQMDRFMFHIKLGHADAKTDTSILRLAADGALGDSEPKVEAVRVDRALVAKELAAIRIDDAVLHYVSSLLAETRRHSLLELGASVRGGIGIVRAAKIVAIANGREFVVPDDIKPLVVPSLRHRVKLSAEAQVSRVSVEQVLSQILETVPFPK